MLVCMRPMDVPRGSSKCPQMSLEDHVCLLELYPEGEFVLSSFCSVSSGSVIAKSLHVHLHLELLPVY